jgi:hypothetical protein
MISEEFVLCIYATNINLIKSSITQKSQTGMIIGNARFSRRKIGTGYVALKKIINT